MKKQSTLSGGLLERVLYLDVRFTDERFYPYTAVAPFRKVGQQQQHTGAKFERISMLVGQNYRHL
ncbi:MAG TPA: hypothetical protein VK168_17425 [Saprospiraceae bacterium]|nr:hypothetical protein [Saprospiraceae bacterium]